MDFSRTNRADDMENENDQDSNMAANSIKGPKAVVKDITGPTTSTFLTETMLEDEESSTKGDNSTAPSGDTVPLNRPEQNSENSEQELIGQTEPELSPDTKEFGTSEQEAADGSHRSSFSDKIKSRHNDNIESHVASTGGSSPPKKTSPSKPKMKKAKSKMHDLPKKQQAHQGEGEGPIAEEEEDDLGIYDDVTDGADLVDNEDDIEMLADSNTHPSSCQTKTPDIHYGHRQAPLPTTSILRDPSFNQLESPDFDSMDDPQSSHVTWNAIEPHFSVSIANMPRRYSGHKANTPASCYSAESRNASRVTSESREAMFRRAMTLLSARCTSTVPNTMDMPCGMSKGDAFGAQAPQYFYVRQDKPRPMPPLKAWNGYNGNVYFEPIQINTLSEGAELGTISVLSSGTNARLHRLLMNRNQMGSGKFDRSDSSTTRSLSRQTGKSGSIRSSTTRQSLKLDKKIVMNGYNENIQDDLALIEGVECTGSLAVRPKSDKTMDKESRRALMYNRDRICKGSVIHRINESRNKSRMLLKVNGGKYVSPQSMSPLLRTQTQYSLSNQRLTTNSPDPYHQQLPPLEQLRASVRHMATADKQKSSAYRYSKPVTMAEEIKPFIKYCPDVKNKRQPSYV